MDLLIRDAMNKHPNALNEDKFQYYYDYLLLMTDLDDEGVEEILSKLQEHRYNPEKKYDS